jgi:ParB-like chromosome segregation protein Spo0J
MSAAIRFEDTPPFGVRFHEYAEIFPWLEGAALEALREDIRANGVREPVVFLGDAILDGRNRYMCARELGLPYPRREFNPEVDGDPLAFVISLNLARRHLTESQRAFYAAKLANMKRTDTLAQNRSANLPNGNTPVSQADAAEMLIQSVQVFHNGKSGPAEPSDMDGLKARIKQWSDRARNVRIRPSQQNTGSELSTADR